MNFPEIRMRRLRKSPALRQMLAETRVDIGDLVYPMFVAEGKSLSNSIPSMPGICQYSPDKLLKEVARVVEAGIPAVILFGIPEHKDAKGSQAYAPNGVIQQAVKMLKKEYPQLVIITDICLCEYTDHGHCGLVENGRVLNDPTLELLGRTAVSHAEAGADIVAPSDMMDGRVGVIRKALDAAGFEDTAIMAYSAKYASAFYGPFREVAGSVPQFGDRNTYQMDPRSGVKQALMEVTLDLAEGADMVIIKPALAYLDVIKQVKERFLCPVVSYNVSGEYAMIKAASLQGWLDEKKTVLEIISGLKRAGSDIILTYHALDIARWLKE